MIIINGNIKTMEEKDFPNGYIHTKDNKIIDIGDMENLSDNLKANEEVIDAKGGLVLPAYVDAHCHIGMIGDGIGFEAEDINEDNEPITPHLRAVDAINSFDECFIEGIEYGVLTVLTGAGSANPIGGQWTAMKSYSLEDCPTVDEMAIDNRIGMKFALGENPKMTYNSKNQSPNTRMGTTALIREQLIKAERYMQEWDEYHKDDDMETPEYDIKCNSLVPVLKREIKAFFHAHRADDILTAIRLTKEFSLDTVLIHATEGHKIASVIKKSNLPVIIGPIISDRSKPELKGLTVKNASILEKAGVMVSICTDHPETPIQYLSLTAGIALQNGFTFEEALKSITINPAKAVGLDDIVGSLKIGKDADILIYSKGCTPNFPLDIISKPEIVIAGGKVFNK